MGPEQQEIMNKLSGYEQQVKQLQQQLHAVEQSINELRSLDIGLDEVEKVIKNDGKKEILAQVGRGIFVEAELKSSELTIDIGNKKFVKKNVPETKEIIKRQIEKLGSIKKDLDNGMEKVNREVAQTISEAQGKDSGSNQPN